MKISDGWMVLLDAATYFFGPIFISLYVCYFGTGQFEYTPNRAKVLAALYGGIANGIVALQAFRNKTMGDYQHKRNGGVQP